MKTFEWDDYFICFSQKALQELFNTSKQVISARIKQYLKKHQGEDCFYELKTWRHENNRIVKRKVIFYDAQVVFDLAHRIQTTEAKDFLKHNKPPLKTKWYDPEFQIYDTI